MTCYATGYACTKPEGHAGPHHARDGRVWGGERCAPDDHVWGYRATSCRCGELDGQADSCGRPLLVRDRVRVPLAGPDPIDPVVPATLGLWDQISDLELHGTVDLTVPVSASAVVELDVPVTGLHHAPESTP